MSLRRYAAKTLNWALMPLGAQLVPHEREKPWDREFAAWIARAKASDQDPNDIGDVEWASDPLQLALMSDYLPYVHADSTVLELGPGTGRVTRHLIGRCREMVLVDYSHLACGWLKSYLKGKGCFRIVHIETPRLSSVQDRSVDMVVANGVFEHLDMDDMLAFLLEFRRVMKPAAHGAFNFNNAATEESMALFRTFRDGLGSKCIFRFHHPDTVRRIAEIAGLQILRLSTSQSRFAHVLLQAP